MLIPAGHTCYGFTLYAQHLILNWLVRGANPPQVPNLYLGLFTTGPFEDGTGTEVPLTVSGASTGYARQLLVFQPATDITDPDPTLATGTTDLITSSVFFPTALTDWGNIEGGALFDDVEGGNMWLYWIATYETISSGDTFEAIYVQTLVD